ncbi:MAG: hypothetical protein HOP11_03700 [Saprospiraceae bacterium]|nr:hypothetical protein [Saprospiraceae bacterium]
MLFLGTWLYLFLLHPHFQSVTEIYYAEGDKVFEISITMTTHDLEKLMVIKTSQPVFLGKSEDSIRNSEWLFDYVEKNFHINMDNIHVDLVYVGFEAVKDELTIYFQTEEIDHITDYITIENTVLMDYHDDQQNIVHLQFLDIKESKKLTRKTKNWKRRIEN